MKVDNRTFIISGGASGLGRACVERLARSGSTNVAILDTSNDAGEALAAKLGPSTRFFRCNVLHTSSVADAVREAARWAYETKRPLAGVVPAAGISVPATILDRAGSPFDLENFDLTVAVNLRGTIDLVRQTVEHMAKVEPNAEGERGVVVMVASSATFDGQRGQVAYAASKGAVASMTLPMARDLARYGIRCVAIAPSLFETGMTNLMPEKVRRHMHATMEFPNRGGRPDEFAQLVLHIIENPMLNGAVIRLDGAARPGKL
ncbi:hypothetical protein L249_0506 [Ophiocordyceps polyrhachis-furcata BCC 54312]|uniref:Ketoreductase domain-containing protein n=1 Tax=Ophiocordyceps polyrhachis-furcata BCC 54312 TaxID=1330021 RepID=A0A367LCQ7_9HYPO|nr:hypothetical protein L249_0506 [Ophiocordyceps polyrhachis-furcata BCC 54312]